MKHLLQVLFVSFMLSLSLTAPLFANNAALEKKQGAYQVVEGRVYSVTARSLELDGKQYPISVFVRVFDNSEKGSEIPMRTIANIGKIDKARIYLIGGKVEKIIVLLNI